MMTKKISLVSISMLLCISLFSCGSVEGSSIANVENNYELKLVDLGEDVDFHSDKQKEYLDDELESVHLYADGTADLSKPKGVRLSWSLTNNNKEIDANYTLFFSDDEEFKNAKEYSLTDNFMDVHNLYLGSTYYWKVCAAIPGEDLLQSDVKSFTVTDEGPRNLYIDGVTNFRDIGGWKTSDGKHVKQGLIYRCGRLNESYADSINVEVTEKGKQTLLNDLKIKTEIDLRNTSDGETSGITSSVISESVNYQLLSMTWTGNDLMFDNIENIKKFFAVLADINNYPLLFHCNIGTDRTGMLAYFINGLMGVSEEDLYRDYLFSNFGYIYSSRNLDNILDAYVAQVKKFSGFSLSQQIYKALVKLGVSSEHLDSLIAILSE